MIRSSLPLLFALALVSATAAARDVKHADPNGACSQDNGDKVVPLTREASPARPSKSRPSVHGDAPASRLPSPRWHSFLPGMFR